MQRRSTLRSLRQETAILPYLANDPYIGLYTTFYLDMLFTNILLILDCGKQIMVDRASISIGMKGRYNLCCSRPITAVQPQPNHSRPTTAVQPQPSNHSRPTTAVQPQPSNHSRPTTAGSIFLDNSPTLAFYKKLGQCGKGIFLDYLPTGICRCRRRHHAL